MSVPSPTPWRVAGARGSPDESAIVPSRLSQWATTAAPWRLHARVWAADGHHIAALKARGSTRSSWVPSPTSCGASRDDRDKMFWCGPAPVPPAPKPSSAPAQRTPTAHRAPAPDRRAADHLLARVSSTTARGGHGTPIDLSHPARALRGPPPSWPPALPPARLSRPRSRAAETLGARAVNATFLRRRAEPAGRARGGRA